MLLLQLADNAWLDGLLDGLTVLSPHSAATCWRLVAGMLAGADSINDLDLLWIAV